MKKILSVVSICAVVGLIGVVGVERYYASIGSMEQVVLCKNVDSKGKVIDKLESNGSEYDIESGTNEFYVFAKTKEKEGKIGRIAIYKGEEKVADYKDIEIKKDGYIDYKITDISNLGSGKYSLNVSFQDKGITETGLEFEIK